MFKPVTDFIWMLIIFTVSIVSLPFVFAWILAKAILIEIPKEVIYRGV